jgi:hypothetical protein
MIGQTYAVKSINLFAEWATKIIFDYYGGSSFSEIAKTHDQDFINIKGWIHPDKLQQKLTHYDIAFLPYFDKENSLVGKLSFPSKFIIYVNAKLPVLFIGNTESSVAKIIIKYEIGLVLSNENNLDKEFEHKVIRLSELRNEPKFNKNMEKLNQDYFSRKNFISKLNTIKVFQKIEMIDIKNELGVTNSTSDLIFEHIRMNKYKKLTYFTDKYLKILNRFRILNTQNKYYKHGNVILLRPIVENNSLVSMEVTTKNSRNELDYKKAFPISKNGVNEIVKILQTKKNRDSYCVIAGNEKIYNELKKNNLPMVIQQINIDKTKKMIILKPNLRNVRKSARKYILIKDRMTLSEIYLLALIQNYGFVLSYDQTRETLISLISAKETRNVVNSNFLFELLNQKSEFHFHDPFINSIFSIEVDINKNEFDLDEIYSQMLILDKLDEDNIITNDRSIDRFIGFLYIIGFSKLEIYDFIYQVGKQNSTEIYGRIHGRKPIKKYNKTLEIMSRIYNNVMRVIYYKHTDAIIQPLTKPIHNLLPRTKNRSNFPKVKSILKRVLLKLTPYKKIYIL